MKGSLVNHNMSTFCSARDLLTSDLGILWDCCISEKGKNIIVNSRSQGAVGRWKCSRVSACDSEIEELAVLSLQRSKAIGDLNQAWHEAKHGITPSFVTEPRYFRGSDLEGTILSLQMRTFLILGHTGTLGMQNALVVVQRSLPKSNAQAPWGPLAGPGHQLWW